MLQKRDYRKRVLGPRELRRYKALHLQVEVVADRHDHPQPVVLGRLPAVLGERRTRLVVGEALVGLHELER